MWRGRGTPHRAPPDSAIVIRGLDYNFITNGGVKLRAELDHATDAAGTAAFELGRKEGKVVKRIFIR